VETRLVPVNAVLALVAGDRGWFEDLGTQGFRLHALELDVQSTPGVIRVDVVLYRTAPDLILLVENKSGRHVEERQARGYAAADLTGIRARGGLPHELVDRPETLVSPLYVCLQEHRQDIMRSLAEVQIAAPVLSVAPGRVVLDGPVPAGLERFSCHDPHLGLPPVRIRLDRESATEEFMAILTQRVVAAAVRGERHVELDELARAVFQGHWVHMSLQGRRELVARFRKAAIELAHGELGSMIGVEGTDAVATRVTIIGAPASADPRGAPQRWQALMRKAARDLGREGPSIVERQAQMSMDDLAIDVEVSEGLDAGPEPGEDRDTPVDA